MLCCNAFENLASNAGERGLAVLVMGTTVGVRFVLQMRAVAFADETNIPQEPLPTMPTNLTLSGSMRIRYCPFCGRKLDDLVVSSAQFIKKLAAEHKAFQNDWGV